MLVISRKIGESFVIGDDIEATVIDITGEKVVLGVSAPKSMVISRSEIIAAGTDVARPSGNINVHSYGRQYKDKISGEQK